MTTATLNRAALLDMLAFIEAHPENWDQTTWAHLHPDKDTRTWKPDTLCGSSFCAAGRVLVNNGWMPFVNMHLTVSQDTLDEDGEIDVEFFIPVKTAKKLAKHFKKTGDWLDVRDESVYAQTKAAEILGISNEDAITLFNADNSLDMLRRMVADLLVNGELTKFYYADCYDDE